MGSLTDRPGRLARGAAIMTAATALSRLTGLVRVIVVAAAMGSTFLTNTYQTANTAPNIVFELLAAGVLTSVFVPTFVDYLVKDRAHEGWAAANAMTTVALVGLVLLSAAMALLAPVIMWILTLGVSDPALRDGQVELGATFLRLFAPQIAFYGVGMIMTGALHAHRKFAVAAVAPIFNNIVVIFVYVTYAAMRGDTTPTVETITTEQTLVLGLGTTLGVVAMTVCLIPQLWRLGWRFRFDFDINHPAVRKAGHLGVWALGYAGGYQVGLLVVLILANGIAGGVAAYQWAYTFFYVPHALFGVPLFNVLFPQMSEHVVRGEEHELASRLRDGVSMLAFIMLPVAALMIATATPLTTLTLEYGVMTSSGAQLVGRVLAAFAIGLPAYSAFLVLTRAFYALSDTRTPTIVNAVAIAVQSIVGTVLFFALADDWAVPGLALGHSLAFIIGSVVLLIFLERRVGAVDRISVLGNAPKYLAAALASLAVMLGVATLLPEGDKLQALASLVVTSGAGAICYLGFVSRMDSPERRRLAGLVRRRGEPK
jgi:putative peptidoglycan lipid II flippase